MYYIGEKREIKQILKWLLYWKCYERSTGCYECNNGGNSVRHGVSKASMKKLLFFLFLLNVLRWHWLIILFLNGDLKIEQNLAWIGIRNMCLWDVGGENVWDERKSSRVRAEYINEVATVERWP